MKKNRMIGKRMAAGALFVSLILGLTACGNSGQNTEQEGNTVTEQEQDNNAAADNENGTVSEEAGVTVNNTVSIDTIREAVKEAYGDNYLPNVLLTEDEILAAYGIESEWYVEAIAEVPMISAQVDTFIAVKAIEGRVADVTNAIVAYQDYLKNDSLQYPANLPKIAASTVVTMDNYVFFIMLGTADVPLEEEDENVWVDAYAEQNRIAVDVIESLLLNNE